MPELAKRLEAGLGSSRLRAVVVERDTSVIAVRIARNLLSSTHVIAPRDAAGLVRRLYAAGNAPVVVSGLSELPEEEWRHLDQLRSRLQRDARTVLVLSPQAARLMMRAAPNLSSWIGPPLWYLETADDANKGDADAAQVDFDRHRQEWLEETAFSSSLTLKVNHPAYRAIIAMGERAIPPILRDLERQPKLWGPALEAITGASPVSPDEKGKMRRVAEVWLQWARENGYAW
jgi:hypothetical protein